MFSVCLQRNDIPQREGRGKLLNPTNRPSGLRRFHSTSHEISNTLQSVGRHSNAQTHTRTRIHMRTVLGLILNLVGSHQRAHVDPAEYQNIFGRDFQERN